MESHSTALPEINWGQYALPGCDCLGFIAVMTADALGLDTPKFMYDAAGEIVVSYPTSVALPLDEAA